MITLIKIAICDDDSMELKTISSMLNLSLTQKLPELQVQTFCSGFSLLDAMEHGAHFDIVILDIIMPGENGITIAKEIRKENTEIEIIFLTSSSEYAVESYEVKANNYLLKPLQEEKLFSALENCLGSIKQKQTSSFVIRSGAHKYTRIIYSKLIYGEAMRKSIHLYLSNHTDISAVMTFSDLVKLLDPHPAFMRPHRSYIVNMHYIENITRTEILLMNGDRIPIPKKRYLEVSNRFFNFVFSNSFQEGDD